MKLRRIKIGRDCALGTLLCLALSACAFGGQIVDRVVAGPILHGVRGRLSTGNYCASRFDRRSPLPPIRLRPRSPRFASSIPLVRPTQVGTPFCNGLA